jgi:hypothetical protein
MKSDKNAVSSSGIEIENSISNSFLIFSAMENSAVY